MSGRRLAAVALGFAVGAFQLAGATAATGAAPVTSQVRLGFPRGDDWEPATAVDNHRHVFVLWSHYGPDPACPGCASPHSELQVSADGGATWSPPRPLHPSSLRQDDPQIVVDPADGSTLWASFMEGNNASEFVAESTDAGVTWRFSKVENLKHWTDKDILAVRGRDVYLAYQAGYATYVSSSHDAGRTWQVNVVVDHVLQRFGESLPGGAAVDGLGRVYVAWGGNMLPQGTRGPVNLYMTMSGDGGANWSVSQIDVSQAPPQCGTACGWDYWGAQMTVAVDGRNRVYALYDPNRVARGVNELWLARSDDGGVTWRHQQQPSLAPQGANHLFPAMLARGDGDVRIAWMDDRNGHDAGNTDPTARWNVFYRHSTNAGTTWSPEFRLSSFVPGYSYIKDGPRPGFLQPYGDYFEMDVDGAGRTHAVFGEGPSYKGPGNVWYATVRS